MSITIHAESVMELRKIFTDMFGPVKLPAAEAPAPKQDKPASKAKEKPVETPAPKQEKPADASRPDLTKDVVLTKIKKIKASTDPDIGTKVKAWLESNSIEKLADCTSDQFYDLQAALGIK